MTKMGAVIDTPRLRYENNPAGQGVKVCYEVLQESVNMFNSLYRVHCKLQFFSIVMWGETANGDNRGKVLN